MYASQAYKRVPFEDTKPLSISPWTRISLRALPVIAVAVAVHHRRVKRHLLATLAHKAFILVLVSILDAVECQLGNLLLVDQDHHLHNVIANRVVGGVGPQRRIFQDGQESRQDLRTNEELLGLKGRDDVWQVGCGCREGARGIHLVVFKRARGILIL